MVILGGKEKAKEGAGLERKVEVEEEEKGLAKAEEGMVEVNEL